MKKIISTVLALLMVMSMIPMLALSISAVETVVEIDTPDELLAFANNIKNKTDTYSGKIVEITADIDMTDKTWPDMSGTTISFAGTLDGNGHTISGLNMTATNTRSGFFGNTDGGAIVKDICITKSSITVKDVHETRCGGIFGRVDGACTIENVYTEIDINVTRTVTSGNPDMYEIGGFIGRVANNAQVNIKNCVAVGDVITDGVIAKVGGLIGYVEAVSGNALVNITDSAVYGNVTANGNSTGLIVGRAKNATATVNITNVIAAGSISFNENKIANPECAAIVGKNDNYAVIHIASSFYTTDNTIENIDSIGAGSTTSNTSKKTTHAELINTVPDGFKTWTTLNVSSGYPYPINVAYMVGHVEKDTADDGYKTAFAGYQTKDGDPTVLRLVGVVNYDKALDEECTAVGFDVEMIEPEEWSNRDGGTNLAPQITTVYTSVMADGDSKAAAEVGGDYIFVATIDGIAQNVGDVTFIVKTFHDVGEERVYDDAYVITYFTGDAPSAS